MNDTEYVLIAIPTNRELPRFFLDSSFGEMLFDADNYSELLRRQTTIEKETTNPL